ncbi:NAD-dependent protein deacylase [Clostridium aminobutyricum]|uniref:NAD-dependent protein deacetylase n=1 Tax=Clostridium aminobutyricum TaxID=33953 RepID=A0A939D8L8_CLOAM|nr:NAD-dependent protein deacylase [Clostridium aminobutyricum]MBN7773176.1 NAD-dependent protein deacylase [Clostridium aminobutyricum]
MDKLKQIIEESNNIVFFGGAGVSTESNIPDFRSESGLYHAVQKYGQSPETMLSHSFFQNHTETFYDYYKNNLIYPEAKPNKAHLALAKLEREGKLKAIVTQNIDGLHQLAGSKVVYELHGSVLRNNCMRCGEFYDLGYIMNPENCKETDGIRGLIPICKKCGGMVKPDVVLYEEPLNDEVVQQAVQAISKADTLIVGGTSLVVYPAAGLVNYFRGKNLVLINKSKTQYNGKANLVINDPIGEVLGAVCEIE